MIDIHSHILPGVDDGSQDIETSIEMIKKEIEDGVTSVILTPHVQSRVSKFEPNQHQKFFDHLKDAVEKQKLDIELFLGAEVFYRSHIDTDWKSLTLGGSKYILVEFSPYIETPIEDIVYDISRMGWIPIVAHVERYPYLKKDDYIRIKKTGALLQTNTTSILGYDHKSVKKGIVTYLLKNKLVDIVSTDSHNLDIRKPNMKDAYESLIKHHDEDYLNQIFETNAKKIIESIKHIS